LTSNNQKTKHDENEHTVQNDEKRSHNINNIPKKNALLVIINHHIQTTTIHYAFSLQSPVGEIDSSS